MNGTRQRNEVYGEKSKEKKNSVEEFHLADLPSLGSLAGNKGLSLKNTW